jgi:transcription elongation factor GreA
MITYYSTEPPVDVARRPSATGAPERGGTILMTVAGLLELERELERLRRRHRQEISEQLRDARSYGGGSNNDEYHALREEQMVVEARIASLEETVARAAVVQPDEPGDGVAAVGSTLLLEDLSSRGRRERYRLVGAHSMEPNTISAPSAMGQALLGVAPGAVVNVELPNGSSREIRVIAVDAQGAS